ncbi:hypothetical protein LARV_01519 [Longilinea arvoryzae]|uniref:Uncharacterized protein n=1 Tax=Longilinea arvoryzae TaxID=360412 RepID=A0A0S7BFK8_9CHLR|nr:hypothetical protein [Longilinea arvoryzae]GAP13764.1 hypothetical protein LARV_01519 [Longilinea arvoryzae]
MKKINILIIIVMLAAFVVVKPVEAQGPTGSWVSGITCQNLTSDIAEVTFDFYQEGESSPALSYPDSIPANGTLKYFTASTPAGLPTSFFGSATVSSSAALSCSVNTQSTGTGTTSNPYRIGTSSGFNDTQVANTMYVPQITKASTWGTYMAIQNATSSAVDIQIQYFDRTTGNEIAAALETHNIPANSNLVVYPGENANLPATFYGSAKITAGSSIGVIVSFYNAGTDYTTAQFQSYNAFASGTKILYAPRVVRKYYGYNSGISVQNISTVPTTLTVDLSFANGQTISYTTPTIQPNASYIAYTASIPELAEVDTYQMAQRYASLKVTADAEGAEIVGITNIDNRGLSADNNGVAVPMENIGKGASVNMALDGTATNTLFFTQVAKKASGFSGGIVIVNTTSSPATCDISFAGQPDSATYNDAPLPANGQISLYLGTYANLPNGFNASVKAICTENVFGTYNFSIEAGVGKYGDSYIEANALNQ